MAFAFALVSSVARADTGEPATMAVWRRLLTRPDAMQSQHEDMPSRVTLGRKLFTDPRLSSLETRSCASCHDPARGLTDGGERAFGLQGGRLRRNTPSLWNLAGNPRYGWDGRAPSLEAQVRTAIEHTEEMGGDWPLNLARLAADAELQTEFANAFPERPAIDPDTVTKALAAYVRSLVSPLTRFDRWITGEETALTATEIAGFRLFTGKAGCVGCHAGWKFADQRHHDIGLPSDDLGFAGHAGTKSGRHAFKTPGLRELASTAPYMHDGSKPTLEAVIDHYTDGIVDRPGVSSLLVRPLSLTETEIANLIAFLETLSSANERPGAAP